MADAINTTRRFILKTAPLAGLASLAAIAMSPLAKAEAPSSVDERLRHLPRDRSDRLRRQFECLLEHEFKQAAKPAGSI